MKPTRYLVEYVKRWIEDEAPETELLNTDSLDQAHRVYAQHVDDLPQIWERTDIRDATPRGDPRGLIWDYNESLIEDVP